MRPASTIFSLRPPNATCPVSWQVEVKKKEGYLQLELAALVSELGDRGLIKTAIKMTTDARYKERSCIVISDPSNEGKHHVLHFVLFVD